MQINYSTGGSVGFSASKLENRNLVNVSRILKNRSKQIGFIEAFISSNRNRVEINMGASKKVESNPFINELLFLSSIEFEGSFSSKFKNINAISVRRKFGQWSPVDNQTLTYQYEFTKTEIDRGYENQVKILEEVIEKFIATLNEFSQSRHLAESYSSQGPESELELEMV